MDNRPNVLLICPDGWPGRAMGAMGHPNLMTPTIDQFAANGVTFTNAYSASPMCTPARRSLMTGTTPKTHGDRAFGENLPLQGLPTLAQSFRDAGYQASAVGKMHVNPLRARIGFDDALVHEAGRSRSAPDDYERFLTEQGYAGLEYGHGIPNNGFFYGPWHLPNYCHPTNWTAREMAKLIARRDSTKPAFWYLAFDHPHPPLTPLRDYMDIYREIDVDMPYVGEWTELMGQLPYTLKSRPRRATMEVQSEDSLRTARRAFYALMTHVDHQIRTVIGTLREQGLIDNTIIFFTSDHAEMMGHHGIFGKGLFYEDAAKIPMIVVPTPQQERTLGFNKTDDRLVELADVMPTVLDLCGIPVPDGVEGVSMFGEHRRDYLYGEIYTDARATRMIRDGRYKLVYYAVGNRRQLFDIAEDPNELSNLAEDSDHSGELERLTLLLLDNLYGEDLRWVEDDRLVGLPDLEWKGHPPDRSLGNHRGLRFR